MAAGTDRQSLYGASQYYRDRHHLKGFWGHAPSRDVTWIHRHARTLAQTLWERFSSGWQSVCVSWWVFTARMAKRFGPEMGRQRRTTWEVSGMCMRHSGRASSRLYEQFKESEMNPAKPSHKWQIRFQLFRVSQPYRIAHEIPLSVLQIPLQLFHRDAECYPESQKLNQGYRPWFPGKTHSRKWVGFFESARAPPTWLLQKQRGEQGRGRGGYRNSTLSSLFLVFWQKDRHLDGAQVQKSGTVILIYLNHINMSILKQKIPIIKKVSIP